MKYSQNLKRFYLQKTNGPKKKKKIKIKNYSILNYDLYLTPNKIFELLFEILNDLIMNRNEYLKLFVRM